MTIIKIRKMITLLWWSMNWSMIINEKYRWSGCDDDDNDSNDENILVYTFTHSALECIKMHSDTITLDLIKVF